MKRTFYLVIIICLFLFACTKEVEKIVERDKEFSWTFKMVSSSAPTQNNSYAGSDFLFLLSAEMCTSLVPDPDNPFGESIFGVALSTGYSLPLDLKFPINSDFFVIVKDYEKGIIEICPNRNIDPAANTIIKLADLDTSFTRLKTLRRFEGEFIRINNKGQILIPYEGESLNSNSMLKAILLDTEIKNLDNKNKSVVVTKTKIIELQQHSYLMALQCVDDNFYISPQYQNSLRIDTQGNVQNVINNTYLKLVFKKNNTLYALDSYNAIFKSMDDGVTWVLIANSDKHLSELNYTSIDGKVVGFYNQQLFEIEITETKLSIHELDNYGLEGAEIVSVVLFKNIVYVSSLRGVYTRSYNTFFQRKTDQ